MSRYAQFSIFLFAVLYIALLIYPLYVWSFPNKILALVLILLGTLLSAYPVNHKRRYSRVSLEYGVFILSVCGLTFPAIAALWTIASYLQLISDAIPSDSSFATISILVGLLAGLILQVSLTHFWSQVRCNERTD